jgi:hypothetical protein
MLVLPGSVDDHVVKAEGFAERVEAALAGAEPLSPHLAATRDRVGIGELSLLLLPARIAAGEAIRMRSSAEAESGGFRVTCGPVNGDLGSFPPGGPCIVLERREQVEAEALAPANEFTPFSVSRIWFESRDPSFVPENDRFPVEHYVPRDGPARAAILILPMWKGGVLLAERIVAGRLAREGYECAILPLPYQFQRSPEGVRSGDWTVSSDLERTKAAMLQAQADVEMVTDWLAARPAGEAGLGVLGISLGAHVAAVAYQLDERYGAGVFVMAGGDPASMVWAGSSETSRMKRELVARGVTLPELRKFLAPLDPAAVRPVPEFPAFSRYRGILMVNASFDRVVPPANAELLHEALGRPAIRWLPVTHYTMAMRIDDVLEMTVQHLARIFRD